MRIELPKSVERFGAARFGELQKVFELDSGLTNGHRSTTNHVIQRIPYDQLHQVFEQMAIIVPVKSERLKLVEGVLSGIPHSCFTIIVSNSPRQPVDRFHMECDALRDFCTFANKNVLIAHQKDPVLARAFRESGYPDLLDADGEIRSGKAEGMIIGTVLAWLAGKKYVGFVDSDNYFPGAVEEYVREYAAGFCMSRSPYSMVRIAWHSKPKIVESKLFFRKWGRTSSNTNMLLNQLIADYTGYETEIIKTGNAGEHALSMDLALLLRYAGGYAVEPYHLINILEQFGGIRQCPVPEAMQECIEVYQVESRNPHLHDAGDTEHIDHMRHQAMQVIYHSPICPDPLKRRIKREILAKGHTDRSTEVTKPQYFPPLARHLDKDRFLDLVSSTAFGKLVKESVGAPAA
jgi:mannosyl-3-phosphoglycerate synthase